MGTVTHGQPTAASGKPYATIVIAASDSIAADKAAADYVCTGTNDEATLAAADAVLAASPNGNGRILLLEGTYHLDDLFTFTAEYSTLEGQGQSTTIHLRGNDGEILLASQHQRIKNLYFYVDPGVDLISNALELADYFQSAEDIYIYSSNVLCLGTGINVSGGGDCRVTNCSVEGARGVGISVSADNVQVSGCMVRGSQTGYIVTGSDVALVDCFAYTIDTPTGDGYAGGVAYAIYLGGSDGQQVVGCRTYSSAGGGISCQGAEQAVIVGNDIATSGPTLHGILLDAATVDCTVVGNSIRAGSGVGTADAIRIDGNSDRNNVQSNTIRGTKWAKAWHVNNADCDDNLITNNDYKGLTATDSGTGTITSAGNRS